MWRSFSDVLLKVCNIYFICFLKNVTLLLVVSCRSQGNLLQVLQSLKCSLLTIAFILAVGHVFHVAIICHCGVVASKELSKGLKHSFWLDCMPTQRVRQ